jgi:hypothetical protein
MEFGVFASLVLFFDNLLSIIPIIHGESAPECIFPVLIIPVYSNGIIGTIPLFEEHYFERVTQGVDNDLSWPPFQFFAMAFDDVVNTDVLRK